MKEHHGFIYGVLSALANAVMTVFVKFAVDVNNPTLIFFRFLIGLLMLLPLVRKKKIHFSLRSIPKHLFRALCGLAAIATYIIAVKLVPIVNAVALWNTAPLFIPFVVLIWMKLLVSKKRFFAVFVGFVGVLFILRPTELLHDAGNLFALSSGLLSAIGWVGIRQLSRSESTETILLYYFVISVAFMFIPMLATWTPVVNWLDWVYILGIGIFGYLNQHFLTQSFAHAPASKVSAMNYLTVIFGALAGWWIFDEKVSWVDSFGISLVIVGGILALLDKSEPAKLK